MTRRPFHGIGVLGVVAHDVAAHAVVSAGGESVPVNETEFRDPEPLLLLLLLLLLLWLRRRETVVRVHVVLWVLRRGLVRVWRRLRVLRLGAEGEVTGWC